MSAVPVSAMGRSSSTRRGGFGLPHPALQTTRGRTLAGHSVLTAPPSCEFGAGASPLRPAEVAAGRSAGGRVLRVPPGIWTCEIQPAPGLTPSPEPDCSGYRGHRSLLHQLVATGWRPLVEQGCHQYEAGSESGDRFFQAQHTRPASDLSVMAEGLIEASRRNTGCIVSCSSRSTTTSRRQFSASTTSNIGRRPGRFGSSSPPTQIGTPCTRRCAEAKSG